MATKRQQQAQETKEKLLKAASKLISERGFDAVSINDIVSECGVAAGTFYLYFKSKDELLIYLSHQIHTEISRMLEETEGDSGLARLRQVLEKWRQKFDSSDSNFHLQTYRVYVALNIKGEEHSQRNDAKFEEEVFYRCLTDAVAQGELAGDTPVDFIAGLMSVEIHGIPSYFSYHFTKEETDAWWNNYIDYIFDGMLKPYMY